LAAFFGFCSHTAIGNVDLPSSTELGEAAKMDTVKRSARKDRNMNFMVR
jgi:hypothetical protein